MDTRASCGNNDGPAAATLWRLGRRAPSDVSFGSICVASERGRNKNLAVFVFTGKSPLIKAKVTDEKRRGLFVVQFVVQLVFQKSSPVRQPSEFRKSNGLRD